MGKEPVNPVQSRRQTRLKDDAKHDQHVRKDYKLKDAKETANLKKWFNVTQE